MPSVIDVAAYILERRGPMTAMKLQKLVYYSQAWSLVWDEEVLFQEEIEAWANGPVVRDLYSRHRQLFQVDRTVVPDGDANRLSDGQRDTINRVLDFYGNQSAQWLSDLTHLEAPWREARTRSGAAPGAFCSEVITLGEMAEYYGGLQPNDAA